MSLPHHNYDLCEFGMLVFASCGHHSGLNYEKKMQFREATTIFTSRFFEKNFEESGLQRCEEISKKR